MFLFENSVPNALKDSYPNIGLEESKFINLYSTFHSFSRTIFLFIMLISENIFNLAKNRKRFLDYFASKHKFNPNDPDNWYKISADMLRKEKV